LEVSKIPKAKKTDDEKQKNKEVGAVKARVTREITRLEKIFAKLPNGEKAAVDGLIKRAAHMRVTLEDYEQDILFNGSVELFQQKAGAPSFERARPVAMLYNSVNTSYQKIIKQLTDLLPKADPTNDPNKGNDGFDDFVDKKS